MDDLQPSENEDKSPHSNPDTAGTFVPLTLRKAVVQTQLWGSGQALGTVALVHLPAPAPRCISHLDFSLICSHLREMFLLVSSQSY